MKNKILRLLEKPWAAYAFATCSAVILYLLLSNISGFFKWISSFFKLFSPVIIGAVTAYLIHPLAAFFKRKVFRKVRKEQTSYFLSVLAAVVCVALCLLIILGLMIPSLIKSVSSLIANWDTYVGNAYGLIDKAVTFAQDHNINVDKQSVSTMVSNAMGKALEWLKGNVSAVLSAIGSVGTKISNVAVGVVFGVCFLFAGKGIKSVANKIRSAYLRKEQIERSNVTLERIDGIFSKYVVSTLLDAAIIGVGVFIFSLIMGFPYAGLIAVVCGVTNIIPTFGPMIGAAVGIFFLLLDTPLNALWFFIFICAWQSVDGMLIKPRLFKGALGIPGIWTLVLIILGGKIGGMLGILLAIPLAAIGTIIYKETIEPKLARRAKRINAAPREPEETEDGKGDEPE